MREAEKDRVSNLPDSILHHILSFLRSKDGARTCVLSQRWNYIWTTVPVLEFKNYSLTSPEIEKFVDFVDGTLRRHNSTNIPKFSLLCFYHHLNESLLHSWISTLIRGNVKELRLDLKQKNSLFIPLSLFTCESLTSLDLRFHRNFTFPKLISFPRLKRLKLEGFEFSDECWNEELFSNSPVLEELFLELCHVSMKFFCISIPTLKQLEVDGCSREGPGLRNCVFKIDAPKLVTFSYKGYAAKEFVLCSFLTLVEAEVYFFEQDDGAQEISQLLRALAHVKCLTVCDEALEAISFATYMSNNLLTFHNVKRLDISDIITTDQRLVAFLKAVPNLESLVIHMYMNDIIEEHSDDEDNSDEDNSDDAEGDGDDGDSIEGENNHDNEDEGDAAEASECRSNEECEGDYDNEDDSWALDNVTTESLFSHLKSVCFQQFLGSPREMKWVRLILRKAKALQMMTIRHCDINSFVNVKSEKELMVMIPSFPRASACCGIKFCSFDWESSVVFR